MDHDNVFNYWLSKLIRNLDLSQEVVCYIWQRILWPWEEPINYCIANKAWEVTASNTEGITSWWHAHHDMQVLTAPVNKVLPSELFGFGELLSTDLFIEWWCKSILFFFREETGNHTDSQDVVDKFEEAFFNNVGVSEKESCGFGNNQLEKGLKVGSEVKFLVVTDKVDGPSGVTGNKCSQSS